MNASVVINLTTAVITIVVGVYVLFGSLFPSGNQTMKYMFGFVLIAYGIYRFVNTFSRIKQNKIRERQEQIDEEREKLLSGK